MTAIAFGPDVSETGEVVEEGYTRNWISVANVFVVHGSGGTLKNPNSVVKGFVWNATLWAPTFRGTCASSVGRLRWVGRFGRVVFFREAVEGAWWHGIAHPFVDNLPHLLSLPRRLRANSTLLATWEAANVMWDVIAGLFREMEVVEVPMGSILFAEQLLTQDVWVAARECHDLLRQMRSVLIQSWGIVEPADGGRLGCVLNRARWTIRRRITNLREVASRLLAEAPQLHWLYAESATAHYAAARVLVRARAYLTPHGAAGVFCVFLRAGAVFSEVLFTPMHRWRTLAAAANLTYVYFRRRNYSHLARVPVTLPYDVVVQWVAVVAAAIRADPLLRERA